MLVTEAKISLRYLRGKNKEKFISINAMFSLLGIAIGVAALVVVMAVMNGFREELTSKIVGLNSDIMINGVRGKAFTHYESLIDKIAKQPNVKKIYPVVIGQALATSSDDSIGVLIKAMRLEDLRKQKMIVDNIVRGDLDDFTAHSAGVMIGEGLARRLGIRVGEVLSLVSPQFSSTVIGNIPRMKDYLVAATFNSGLSDFDQNCIVMLLEQGQIFYDLNESQVNQLEIYTDNPYESPKISYEIMQLLDDDRLYVSDWQQINVHIFNALKTEKVAMFVILTLIILVASFNIISCLVMLVIDKTREIAILKTIGVSQASIMRIFLICGLLIGASGTIMGAIIGLIIASNIEAIKQFLSNLTGTNLFDPVVYYLNSLPAKVDLNDVATIVIMSLFLSFFSTLYPAAKAAKLSPVKGLKND